MGSQEWLERFGLKARRLLFYDALEDVSFRHDKAAQVHNKNEIILQIFVYKKSFKMMKL